MSIRIQCPQCREKYNAGNEYLGRHFRCKCDAIIGVPDLDEILDVPAGAENASPAEAAIPAGTETHARTRTTFYGYMALILGTSGILAAATGLIFSVAMPLSPILQNPQENACVVAGSFAASLLAGFAAAVFRMADIAVRRSGLGYFF